MKVVSCRKCKTMKTAGDICPGCGAGSVIQLLRVRKGQPMGVFNTHGIHEPVFGVLRSEADGH